MFRMCKHGCPTGTDLWVEMIRGLGGLLKAIVFDGHCGPSVCVCVVVGVADVLQILGRNLWDGSYGNFGSRNLWKFGFSKIELGSSWNLNYGSAERRSCDRKQTRGLGFVQE